MFSNLVANPKHLLNELETHDHPKQCALGWSIKGPNQRWSLDFVSDVLADGRRFRVLVVVDDFTRECLTLVVDTSLSGARVVRELEAIVGKRGRHR